MRIAIIGAGAAGMAAAIEAAASGNNQILLFERQARVGRKLLATGNGRCNLSNRHANPSRYHGTNPDFVQPALDAFPVEAVLEFFQSLGLYTVTEPEGKIYPYSDQANSVVDVLRFALNRQNIQLLTATEIVSVKKQGDCFLLKDQNGVLHISLTNMDLNNQHVVAVNIDGMKVKSAEGEIITADDVHAYNDFGKADEVKPAAFKGAKVDKKGQLLVTLPAHSVVTLTVK